MAVDPNIYRRAVSLPGIAAPLRPCRVLFLLFPGFPMMAFTAMVEPMRAANGLAGHSLYTWGAVAMQSGTVEASNGLCVTAQYSVEDAPPADRIVVCSGGDADRLDAEAAVKWIRATLRRGAMLGAVADGAFLLARAGLLDGYRCTLHWTSQPAFAEAFPRVALQPDLYVIDRGRFTSAGGVGAMDMMLELIRRDHGRPLADGVAEWFVHTRSTVPAKQDALPIQLRTGLRDMVVLSAIARMEQTLEHGIEIEALAREMSVSQDRLVRGFRRETGRTPGQYLRDLKVARATDLLTHSDLSVSDIALACGYADVSAFGRMFRRAKNCAPMELRRAAGRET